MAKSLRQHIFGVAVAVPVALGGATGIAPNDAQAANLDCPADVASTCTQIRGQQQDFVQTAASRISHREQGVTLIYFGQDRAEQQKADSVVNFFDSRGVSSHLIISDGPGTYMVYVQGMRMTNEFSAAGLSPKQLGEHINQSIIQRNAAASVSAPGSEPGG